MVEKMGLPGFAAKTLATTGKVGQPYATSAP